MDVNKIGLGTVVKLYHYGMQKLIKYLRKIFKKELSCSLPFFDKILK